MLESQITETVRRIDSKRGLRAHEKEAWKRSLRQLDQAKLPILLDLHDFSNYIPYEAKEIASILNATDHYYRGFDIPKRSGGYRKILAPFPSLSIIQKWIASSIFSNVEIHRSAIAYKNNSSIKDHVEPHLNNPTLLKIDIRNFFPSISIQRVGQEFLELGYTSRMSYALSGLLTLHGCVPQGAPSSPLISNIVLRKIDSEIETICNTEGINYTRYADDFAFSGKKIPASFIAQVSAILSLDGFEVNYKKTRQYEAEEKTRFLTGLVLTPDRIRPPKNFRRWVVQRIYYLEKYIETDLSGLSKASGNSEILNNVFLLESLRGKLGYWNWVDPFDKTAVDCLGKLNAIESKLMQI